MWIVEAILVVLSGFQHELKQEQDWYTLRLIGGPNIHTRSFWADFNHGLVGRSQGFLPS